jgi:replicative DNA helicase
MAGTQQESPDSKSSAPDAGTAETLPDSDQLSTGPVVREFVAIEEIMANYFDQIDFLYQNRGQVFGVPTGFTLLDELTGGLQRSELVVIAARPGMGKTSFALNVAAHAALRCGVPVGIFPLEMSKDHLVQRLVSSLAGIDSHCLRTGQIEDHAFPKIAQAIGELGEAPIYIDDTPGISIVELCTKARRLQAEHDLGLIVVDYLQLVRGRRSENRVQEVSDISRSLKDLARELNIPVVATSQLSRTAEQRPRYRPQLADLRESGSIEEDADVVMFILREELYDPTTPRMGIADIIIAKHRNGPTADIELAFLSNQTRFANLVARYTPAR